MAFAGFRTPALFLSLLLPTAFACGDDDGPMADGGPADASQDGAADAGADAAALDSGPADGGPFDAGPPPPVAPARDLEPVAVDPWLTTSVPGTGFPDPVREGIRAGTFEMPSEGGDWRGITPGPEGQLAGVLGRSFYAVTSVDAAAPGGLIVRADTVSWVQLGTARQPGDPYGTRTTRVPFHLVAGENVVVVQAVNGRRTPEVLLWTTSDELYLNPADVTAPDLRVGDDSPQWVGLPVLNLADRPALDATARVVDNAWFRETTVRYPALAAGAATQVAFRLEPKVPWAAPDETVTARLRVESHSMDFSYEREVELSTVAADVPFRRTFRSAVDGSAQYYGVVPPRGFDPAREYALVLATHGAGVQGIGHARAYSPKDWAYVVAPTNRRPFGFDWEVWGRKDGIEVLDEAMATYRIDETRVYLTGHSMGGHGAWQLGVLFPGRFAVVGPSAGWSSFYTYTGRARPSGAFARSQASSDTNTFIGNLARRAVYIIHGDADDNVPVREGRDMYSLVSTVTSDADYHEEPGAGHWWDGPASPGTDCVDWPPLFDLMQARTLDPTELDFEFRTPSPWVSPTHSYVTVHSAETPWQDITLTSTGAGDTVTLTTDNARSLVLDGVALAAKGIAHVVVDGAAMDVAAGPMAVGPADGKRLGLHGPLNEVLERPVCFVYDPAGPAVYRQYAAFLLSNWSIIGNGSGCAMPVHLLPAEVRASHNIVYLGLPPAWVDTGALPLLWDADEVSVGGTGFGAAAMTFVFPEGERLSGAFVTTRGSEYLLYGLMPFTSGFVVPDYLVWSEDGGQAAGFFDASWSGIMAPP